MQSRENRRLKKVCVAFFSFLCTALLAGGTTISLHAYTGWSSGDDEYLAGPNGVRLADDSWVMIVGSYDNARENMTTGGGYMQSRVSNDVVVGTFQLDTGDDINNRGWFDLGGFTYESTEVRYLYIYFFDNQGDFPIQGVTPWGYSAVFDATGYDPFTYSIDVDFTDGSDLHVSATNNFIVIPEPSTGGFMIFFGLMGVCGLPGIIRACNKKKEPRPAGGGDGGSL